MAEGQRSRQALTTFVTSTVQCGRAAPRTYHPCTSGTRWGSAGWRTCCRLWRSAATAGSTSSCRSFLPGGSPWFYRSSYLYFIWSGYSIDMPEAILAIALKQLRASSGVQTNLFKLVWRIRRQTASKTIIWRTHSPSPPCPFSPSPLNRTFSWTLPLLASSHQVPFPFSAAQEPIPPSGGSDRLLPFPAGCFSLPFLPILTSVPAFRTDLPVVPWLRQCYLDCVGKV